MSDDDRKSTPATLFNGKERNFIYWEQKSIARAYKKKFHDVLMGIIKIPQYGINYDYDKSLPTDPVQEKLDSNLAAYSDSVNSIDTTTSGGRTAFLLVSKATSPIYPTGDSCQAFINL